MINPTQHSATRGAAVFESGKIYIGAKRPNEQMRGTLIHELCHLAMQLIYKNKCNPYPSADDTKSSGKSYMSNESAFQLIISNINSNKITLHEIINHAFTQYKSTEHAAELIVRVPHLIVQLEEEGLEILNKQTPKLLSYYNDVILPDMMLHIEQQKLNYFQIELDTQSLKDILQEPPLTALTTSLSQSYQQYGTFGNRAGNSLSHPPQSNPKEAFDTTKNNTKSAKM